VTILAAHQQIINALSSSARLQAGTRLQAKYAAESGLELDAGVQSGVCLKLWRPLFSKKLTISDFYNLFTTFGYMQRQLQRAIGGAAMATDDRRSAFDRRTDQDRRRGVDTRSDEQKRLQGERRANSGRRSSFNRRVVKNRFEELETEG